ncbi:MAG: EVE domain-containing protein [Xanthomonadales bacterium]|nr:EVE domain-containing protein [Xanthomonadales bacterium]
MNFWLMKSEPEEFSIDDLERVGSEPWNGVRNYQARNYMRDGMKRGDRVLFYHSNCQPPGIVGIARIAGKARPDPTQFDPESDYYDPGSKPEDPRWLLVDVVFDRRLRRLLSLDELKTHAEALGDFPLLRRGNRLSVLPVTAEQWNYLIKMEKQHGPA